MTEPLLSQLAKRISRPISEETRQKARFHLLDWLACIAGARSSEAGELGAVISPKPWEKATYLGNVLKLGDHHGSTRITPGAVIWPAAMSLPSAPFNLRIEAGIRGYEAMLAIGMALDDHHHAHWDATATTGAFGAAAAFGSVIGFAAIEHANAMGNAGSVSGGLQHMQHDDVLTRHWHIYNAVRMGRDAAMHVHYGATGPQELLEGRQGFFEAMTDTPGSLGGSEEGWMIDDVQIRSADGQPIAEISEELLRNKMQTLAEKGGLTGAEADRAAALALRGKDAADIDRLLDDWLPI